MTSHTVLENSTKRMDVSIEENGETSNSMDMVLKNGVTVANIKVSLKETKRVGSEYINGVMESNMSVNGEITI